MTKTLFICLGNICRSQMGEAIFNYITGKKDATSAGVYDFTPKDFKTPIDEVVSVMGEIGVDVSDNIVKTVTQRMVDESERIVVFCKKDEVPDFVRKSGKCDFRHVKDPYGKSIDEFRKVRNEIRRIVIELIDHDLQSNDASQSSQLL